MQKIHDVQTAESAKAEKHSSKIYESLTPLADSVQKIIDAQTAESAKADEHSSEIKELLSRLTKSAQETRDVQKDENAKMTKKMTIILIFLFVNILGCGLLLFF